MAEKKQHKKQAERSTEIQSVVRFGGGRGSQTGDVAMFWITALTDDLDPAGRTDAVFNKSVGMGVGLSVNLICVGVVPDICGGIVAMATAISLWIPFKMY